MPASRQFHTRALAAFAVTGVLLLAACGGDDDDSSGDSTVPEMSLESVTSDPGSSTPTTLAPNPNKPTVSSLPAVPVAELGITDLRDGEGDPAVEGDTVVVNYIGVRSADGAEFDNSYDRNEPFPVGPLGTASVIDGWNQGLVGVKTGGMRQIDIPNALAYGDSAQGDIIQPGDDLTFIVEVLAVIPAVTAADEPQLSIAPTAGGGSDVTTTDLVEGTGAEAVAGKTVSVQYVAFSGADGAKLESGWETGQPIQFQLGGDEILPGIDTGVTGMKVGGRREVVIPAELAFGAEGNEELGLPAGADLIMVFDLLAVY
jgi:peptidylprolyl isomerase